MVLGNLLPERLGKHVRPPGKFGDEQLAGPLPVLAVLQTECNEFFAVRRGDGLKLEGSTLARADHFYPKKYIEFQISFCDQTSCRGQRINDVVVIDQDLAPHEMLAE